MNRYYVVMPDGQRYGPATLPHLADWVREGRVLPETVVEDAQTGHRFFANQVQGLPFGLQGQPAPGLGQPHATGFQPTTYQDPYQSSGPVAYPGSHPQSYGQDPYAQLPPIDMGPAPSSGLTVVSFVLSLIGSLTCFGPLGIVLSLVALVVAVVARTRNDRGSGCAIVLAASTLAVALLFAIGRQILAGGG